MNDSRDPTLTIAKGESWKMFNRISNRYDLLNRVLSFGLDIRWRRRLVSCLPSKNEIKLLDLATGTGDVVIDLCRQEPRITKAYGIDLAEEMLTIGKKKVTDEDLDETITLQKGDAQNITFGSDEFDAVTISFGIRNLENPITGLREMYRVLKPQGRLLVLEFSMPASGIIRFFNILYLRIIVPAIGGLVSGDWQAYRYLDKTIETFPYGDQFRFMIGQVGFKNVRAIPLLFGTATIYQGDKPGGTSTSTG